MIQPPKGILPKDYAAVVMDYQEGEKPSFSKQVKVTPGMKCTTCKKGQLNVENKEYAPGRFMPELKCSTPGCRPSHSSRGSEYFVYVQRSVDPRRFPNLAADARRAQDKWGPAACIALNSRTFLFFGMAPS